MNLIPIRPTPEENTQFIENPVCRDTIFMCMNFYTRIGFQPPWICYYVMQDRKLVGSGAFKGKPKDGKVEIAYGTFDDYRQKGIGTAICRELVQLSLKTDPAVRITARTLPDNEGSIKVLKNNGFVYNGMIHDEEDGQVCEWEFINLSPHGM